METMYEKVRAILAKQLRVDAAIVTLDAQIKKDLGADSLDILQLLMRLEDQYGITIPDKALATFSSTPSATSSPTSSRKALRSST